MKHVGIDLGTTNLVTTLTDEAAICKRLVFRNGRPEDPTMLPAVVGVTETGEILVGQPALDLLQEHPDCVVRDTKYDMGQHRTFSIGRIQMTAEEAAVHLLSEVMAELKRQFPEEDAFHAFVTVPARFDTQAPRHATKEALQKAGFLFDEQNALTDEPIAAAIAYSSKMTQASTILVVDFGGGTFDLSLLHSSMVGQATSVDRLQVLGWGGDLHLGGNDVDAILRGILAEHVLSETGIDLSAPPNSMHYADHEAAAAALLWEATHDIKVQLYDGTETEATIYIPDLLPDYDLDMTLSLEVYRTAVQPLTQRLVQEVKALYAKTNHNPKETDYVLVCGGMAKEPTLLEFLRRSFGEERVLLPDDAMYLVSRGAAICNSNARIHVDHRAYSSIGVLMQNRQKVDVVIAEGQEIDGSFHCSRRYAVTKGIAQQLQLTIAEWRGTFDGQQYAILYDGLLPLRRKSLLHTKLDIDFSLNEDRLLIVTVTQPDGTKEQLSIRL